MKIAVMGAGGIGSYLGALLARAGHEVTLICRGRHLAAIRAGALVVRQAGGEWRAPLAATDDPAQVGVADVVVAAVKLYDLERAAQAMRPMVGPQTMVVPIQNGVTSHETLDLALGRGHALGGTVFVSATISEPGVVTGRSNSDRLVFGEIDGGRSARALRFQRACRDAGIDAVLSAGILADMWAKFAVVAGTSAVCALARQSVGEVCGDESLCALMLQGMREVMQVAAAKGIVLAPDTDARGLAFNRSVAYGSRISLLEDLENGKPLELEWLSGHVARQGASHGVPTPLHAMAYACLRPHARGRAAA